MVLESHRLAINTALDRLLADTASALVLLLTPRGELAAYRGPADRTTAAAIVKVLSIFSEPSEPITIHRLLLEARAGGNLYLASVPPAWKLILIDHDEAPSTRLGAITPFIRLAIADLAQILQAGSVVSPLATADTLGLLVYAEPFIASTIDIASA